MCVCVHAFMCAAPISSLHSTSAGAVRSTSGLASQIKDVTAAAPCPSADRLHSLSVYLSSVSSSVSASPSSVSLQDAAALSAQVPGPNGGELRRVEGVKGQVARRSFTTAAKWIRVSKMFYYNIKSIHNSVAAADWEQQEQLKRNLNTGKISKSIFNCFCWSTTMNCEKVLSHHSFVCIFKV